MHFLKILEIFNLENLLKYNIVLILQLSLTKAYPPEHSQASKMVVTVKGTKSILQKASSQSLTGL